MVYQKKTINNVPTKIPLSNSAPVGNPIGTIISTYKKIQPRNYLYCDGSTFDETLYPALYLYLGTNVLPDYRECAIVGAEKNTTDVFDSTEIDPSTGLAGTQNHDVYTQGQFKDDQLQNHSHYLTVATGGSSTSYGAQYTNQGSDAGWYTGNILPRSARIGTVTRGKRKAVYYYIKAVDGVDISDEDTFLNTVKDFVTGYSEHHRDGDWDIYTFGKSYIGIYDRAEGAAVACNTTYGSFFISPVRSLVLPQNVATIQKVTGSISATGGGIVFVSINDNRTDIHEKTSINFYYASATSLTANFSSVFICSGTLD